MTRIRFIILAAGLLASVFTNTEIYSQKTSLRAGISKVDITPSESLFMGGYDACPAWI